MDNGIASQPVSFVAVAGAVMYIQRYLKQFVWYQNIVKAFPGADKYAHRIIAGLGSLIAAVGIHYTLSGDSTVGWVFHLTIPNIAELWHGTTDFLKVFILQQVVYDATKGRLPV